MSFACDTENYNISSLSDSYPGLQPTTSTADEVRLDGVGDGFMTKGFKISLDLIDVVCEWLCWIDVVVNVIGCRLISIMFLSSPSCLLFYGPESVNSDFQDSPDDEEDTKSILSYQPPFQNNSQPKFLSSSQHKPELRPTKDFKNIYNKVKAKLALLSSSASASKSLMVKNKGLIVEAYKWDEEEVLKNHGYLKLKDLPCKSDTGKILLADTKETQIIPPIAPTDTSATELCFSASKVNSAPASALASKLKNVKTKDDLPLSIVIKELNILKLQISKSQSSYSRNNKSQQCERTDHRTCDHVEYMSTMNMSQHLKGQGGSSSRSKTPRPSKHFFPPCIHCGSSDHLSDDCVNYPICDICGSYDHDIHGHNKIMSLRRGIKPRNP
ncbi:hypothetical protein Tco_0626865 [Tanacetum coccineum]|uniref:CCHC-type domain-containing protein n=1 Tax=Tanacetum coccineum TaxID=301880 RepID=A0ABQ4WKV5_9ASTR